MPVTRITTTGFAPTSSVMYSLKVPLVATSMRWPFTVREAPGSVLPFTWRMFPRASRASKSMRGGASWAAPAWGLVTLKSAKSEKLPSTPPLSTAATLQ